MKTERLSLPIYLDYAAATPLDPEVKAAMLPYLDHLEHFGNPASTSHRHGWLAQEALESARQAVAEATGASFLDLYFTSGATESINLALQGMVAACAQGALSQLSPAAALADQRPHVLTSAVEHKAVLDTLSFLEKQGLISVTALKPDSNGQIHAMAVSEAIRPETFMASFMHVNNELGTINPIEAIAAVCREKKVFLHVDAAQSMGKVPVELASWQADLVSFSGHKAYGPKGVGALYVSKPLRTVIRPLNFGGGQERRLRPGTSPLHQIIGMAKAFQIVKRDYDQEIKKYCQWREAFLVSMNAISGWVVHCDSADCVPNIISLGIEGVDGETLISALKDVSLSSGSACNSVTLEPSHVLLACGIPRLLAAATLRVSFGRFSTENELVQAAQSLCEVVEKLR